MNDDKINEGIRRLAEVINGELTKTYKEEPIIQEGV